MLVFLKGQNFHYSIFQILINSDQKIYIFYKKKIK